MYISISVMFDIFMAHRAIPIIAFHGVESIYIYIYIYMFVSLARLCIVYVVKEVASFLGARSINGVARKRNTGLRYRPAG